MRKYINKVTNANCFDIIPKIPDKSIDLLLTDPPYGVLKTQKWDNVKIDTFTKEWWEMIKPKMKENSSAYIFFGQKYIPLGFKIFKPHRMLIWHHPNLAKCTKKMFLFTYDPIFYIKFGKPTFQPSFVGSENVDVFKYSKPQSNWPSNMRWHPTSKPVPLIENFIKISSNENDIVLDPFLGSGTTAVAAQNLHRRFIAIEKNTEYCKISKKRLMQKTLL